MKKLLTIAVFSVLLVGCSHWLDYHVLVEGRKVHEASYRLFHDQLTASLTGRYREGYLFSFVACVLENRSQVQVRVVPSRVKMSSKFYQYVLVPESGNLFAKPDTVRIAPGKTQEIHYVWEAGQTGAPMNPKEILEVSDLGLTVGDSAVAHPPIQFVP